MAGELVTIATFDLPPKARLAQNVLERAGIKAVVMDENTVAMDWLLGNAIGWVKVQVLEEDAERAVAALEEALGVGDEAVDQKALAAEAEATRTEDEGEPPRSPMPRKEAGRQAGSPEMRSREPDGLTDDEEPKPTERDEYARRLFLTAVFSVVVPPLWFYAIYLFLNAALGEGPISQRGRTHLFRGGVIMAAGLVFLLVLIRVYRMFFE